MAPVQRPSSLRARLFVSLLLPVLGTAVFAGIWAKHEWGDYRRAQQEQQLESALISTSIILTDTDLQHLIVDEIVQRGWAKFAPTPALRAEFVTAMAGTHRRIRDQVAKLRAAQPAAAGERDATNAVIRAFDELEAALGVRGTADLAIPTSARSARLIGTFGERVGDALAAMSAASNGATTTDAGAIVDLTEIQRHVLEEGRVTVLATLGEATPGDARHERRETDMAIRLSLIPDDARRALIAWDTTDAGRSWRSLQSARTIRGSREATRKARQLLRARRSATDIVQAEVTTALQMKARSAEATAFHRFLAAVIAALVVIATSLILGWVAIRGPLRRLRDLERHARLIAAGDVDLPSLAVTGTDETATLAHAFDEMAGMLRTAKGQLDQIAAGDGLATIDGTRVPGAIGDAIHGSIDRLTRITRELRSSEELARLTVASAVEAIWMVDHEARITSANASAQSMAGRHRDAMIGVPIDDIIVLDDPEPIWNAAHRQMTDVDCTISHWSGTVLEAVVSTRSVVGADGALHSVVFVRDVSERKRFEQQLEWESTHDPLTGLPNRLALSKWVADAAGELTVLFIDLDRFKTINDALGHRSGDSLLRQVAARLCAKVREEDLVARLGGDEFVIVHRGDVEIDARQFADRLITAIEAPFNLGGTVVHVSASIGIVKSEAGPELAELVRRADIAMCRAKQLGRAKVVTFDDSMHRWAERRIELEEGLRAALSEGQLWPAFQPIVDVQDESLRGVELLARWRHPESGDIAPGEFIPVAEESALIVDVGRWALREAAMAARDMRQIDGTFDVPIAVNISGAHLMRGDLVGDLLDTVRVTGIDPSWLTLEVTETWLLDEADHTVDTLHTLSELGVGLSIDDFGTGYSSLTYLRRIPAATVKVDRSYVLDADDSATDIPIVRLVTTLAHELGMTVVAEGVETAHQQRLLRAAGCDCCQGYHFARPMTFDELTGWVAGRRNTVETGARTWR